MNYCKDCKFREQFPFWEEAPLCLHAKAELPNSPVTGKPCHLYCSTARMEGSICEMEGKLFEPISVPCPKSPDPTENGLTEGSETARD